MSPEREATPSLLGAEHRLKKRVKIIKNIFFNFTYFSDQTMALKA